MGDGTRTIREFLHWFRDKEYLGKLFSVHRRVLERVESILDRISLKGIDFGDQYPVSLDVEHRDQLEAYRMSQEDPHSFGSLLFCDFFSQSVLPFFLKYLKRYLLVFDITEEQILYVGNSVFYAMEAHLFVQEYPSIGTKRKRPPNFTPRKSKINKNGHTTRIVIHPLTYKDPVLDVEFDLISNDGTHHSMIMLVSLKNLFSVQLPKMPLEYITRLVFDRKHFSLVLSRKGRVIGGVCCRSFHAQRFAEIVFLAVSSAEQVKGFGTSLMNHLKELAKTDGIDFFLTYADNYATGYFKKQGFAKQSIMDRSHFRGFIKEYDGGTLMECKLNPLLNYIASKSIFKAQKLALEEQMQSLSKRHISQNPVPQFVNGCSRIEIYEIPGLLEAGFSKHALQRHASGKVIVPSNPELVELSATLGAMVDELFICKYAWPFLEPVDIEIAPDYLDIIEHPMDLSLIRRRVNNHHYKNKEMFLKDMCLVVNNCKKYNSESTTYYRTALHFERKFQHLWKMSFDDKENQENV